MSFSVEAVVKAYLLLGVNEISLILTTWQLWLRWESGHSTDTTVTGFIPGSCGEHSGDTLAQIALKLCHKYLHV